MTLKELRISKGFKRQTEFAKAIGRKVSTVNMWEKGNSAPRTGELIALAAALDVELKELLDAIKETRTSVAR
jgi:Helix-turn-helix.